MDNLLPIIYLLILLFILSSLAFFLIQEILKKRKLEDNLYSLQKKVRENKATGQDHYFLGTIYLSKKLFDQAIIQFRYALKSWDSTDTTGLANLYNTIGFTYFESEQYDLAIYYYKEAVKIAKDYSKAWNNLGYAYEKKKMMVEALESYRSVLMYDKQNEIANSRFQSLQRKVKKSG